MQKKILLPQITQMTLLKKDHRTAKHAKAAKKNKIHGFVLKEI